MNGSDSSGNGGGRGRLHSLSSELDNAFGETVDAEAASAVAFLVGLSGKHAGKLFRIRPGESLIGRTSKALVVLDEKGVSHQHARLTFSPGRCVVTDLESTNGTFVNDERLTGPRELIAGDVMRFGTSRLGYLTDAEDEEQHTRALARVNQPAIGAVTAPVMHSTYPPPQVGSYAPPPVGSYPPPPGGLARVPGVHVVLGDGGAAAVPERSAIDAAIDIFRIVVELLGRYKWFLVVGALVCAALGGSSMLIWPPKSTAEAEVMLRQESVSGKETSFASRSPDYFAFAEKNFANEDLVAQTIEEMNLPKAKVGEFAGQLEFEKVGQSLFRSAFSHPDDQLAEEFLSHHLKNYLETEIGKAIKVLASQVDLLRSQYEENGALLKKQEADLRDFKSAHINELPDSASDQMRSRLGLVARRDELAAAAERYSKQYEFSVKQLASEDAFASSNVARSTPYEEGLVEVRRNIAAARAKGYTDEHPELKKMLQEEQSLIRLRDQTIGSGTTDLDRRTNPEHKRLTTEVAGLKIAMEAAGQELAQINSRLAEVAQVSGAMPAVEAELGAKIRDVENSKSLHDRLYEQLKAKELELQFERASVEARYEVMSAPEAYKINRQVATGIRVAAGAVLGIIIALFVAALHWVMNFARERAQGNQFATSKPAPILPVSSNVPSESDESH
jgi:hypothetical protein